MTVNKILPSLSIADLENKGLTSITSFCSNIAITNQIETLDDFKVPCRMDATTILIGIDGDMDCSINMKRYRIEKDCFMVCLAGDIIQIHQSNKINAYAVLLSSTYLNELQIDFKRRSLFYMNNRKNAVTHVPHKDILGLKPYYELLKENMTQPLHESAAIIKGLAQSFSYTIISLVASETDKTNLSSPHDLQLFDRFMAFLSLYHSRERSVTFYAQLTHLTPNYLSCAIKNCSGKSASEWINEYVILEAKILLGNSNLRIQEIAYQLNFPSQSAFGKYFRIQTGISPKKYRKELTR